MITNIEEQLTIIRAHCDSIERQANKHNSPESAIVFFDSIINAAIKGKELMQNRIDANGDNIGTNPNP
jgi:hypothetical protein